MTTRQTMRAHSKGIWLAISIACVAPISCATAEEKPATELPPPKKPVDASALEIDPPDTNVEDTSVAEDSSVGDSGEPVDSSGTDSGSKDTGSTSCIPSTSENRVCGKCGTQTRYCSVSSTWGEWSTCTGEKIGALYCTPGETRTNECGKCGIAKDTCDSTTCIWSVGSCLGEGACTKGATETTAASCSVVGEIRTRTCSDKCAWSAYSDCALPKGWLKMASAPTTFSPRGQNTAVWSGTEMIVWGGYSTSLSPYVKKDGVAYNLAADSWRTINAAVPTTLTNGRYLHSAVWTGTEMLVFGGYDGISAYKNDGGAYNASGDTWRPINAPTTPIVLAGRYGHAAVWTGERMVVWGGYGSGCTGTYCADGALYDPVAGNWAQMAAAPPGFAGRWKHSMVWTGTEIIIFGGQGSAGYLKDGARYDPKTNTWVKFSDPPIEVDGRIDHVAVYGGSAMLIWGGYGNYVSPTYGKSTGAAYAGAWTAFTAPADDVFGPTGITNKRFGVAGWYGAGKLWLFSGANGNSSSGAGLPGGAWYEPSTAKWGTMDVTGAPPNRVRALVVWTGKEAIVFGGQSSGSTSSVALNDGGVYRP